jgi:ABC-type multidrug transport system fused ATPase/permease subunit
MEAEIKDKLIKALIEFFVFLLVVILLNIGVYYIDQLPVGDNTANFIGDCVKFLNQSVLLLGLVVLMLFLGDVFRLFNFPFDLPTPLFNSIGILLVVKFIYDVFMFLISKSPTTIELPFEIIFIVVSVVVILVILITGYYSIFANRKKPYPYVVEKKDEKKQKIEDNNESKNTNEKYRYEEKEREENEAEKELENERFKEIEETKEEREERIKEEFRKRKKAEEKKQEKVLIKKKIIKKKI